MRRDIGAVLASLGTLLIVMAVVLPTYIVGQVVKFPLSEYETATLTGTGMTYFGGVERVQLRL
jgi:Porin PorA